MGVELQDEVRELIPAGRSARRVKLLLLRCRLMDAARQQDRHQAIVIEQLVRLLSRSFPAQDLVVPLSDAEILLILNVQGVNVATVLVREAIAEVRSRLLGEDLASHEFVVDALNIGSGDNIGSLRLMTVAARAGGGAAQDEPRAAPADPVLTLGNPLQLGQLRYSFVPVRDLRQKAVTTYFLHAHGRKAADAAEETDYDILHGGENSSIVASLDLQVVKRALAELAPYRDQKVPFFLAWHLHVRTLESAVDFRRYAKVLSELEGFAKERIVVELVGIRPDWPVSRMQGAIGMLRRHVGRVAVRVDLDCTIFGPLRECGAQNACVALPGSRQEPELLPMLGRFCAGAARAGLATVAQSVGSRSLASMAIGAGFRYIHVGYLGEDMPATRPASRFEVAELFALPG